jgi:hypothetical protein
VRRILATAFVPFAVLVASCGGGGEQADVPDTVVAFTTTTVAADTAADAALDDDADPAEPGGAAVDGQGARSAVAATLRQTSEQASAAGTGKVDLVMEMSVPGLGPVSFTATGAYDDPAGKMAMSMDFSSMFADLAEATGEAVPPGFDDPMRIVVDGDAFYMLVPQLSAETRGRWLSASIDELSGGTAELAMGTPTDPGAMLDALRGVSGDVEEVGREQVRGVDTTRYATTVDLRRALDDASPAERERLRAQLDVFGSDEMPVEVWVDDDGLARRLDMHLDGLLPAQSDGSAVMTMEFYDYGEPVDISTPPAGETVPLDEIPGLAEELLG